MEKMDYILVLMGVVLVISAFNLYGTMDIYNKFNSLEQDSEGSNVNNSDDGAKYSVDDDPMLGSENAPVTMIIFTDFQCPYTKIFFNDTFPLIKQNYIDTGKVKFVYRDFPLSMHQYAQKAAEAAECADEQGKFWEYHSMILENQDIVDIESLKQFAVDLGLDTSTFNTCLDTGEMTSEVEADIADGSSYGVTGTPTFFINDQKIVGAQPYSNFESIIEQELS